MKTRLDIYKDAWQKEHDGAVVLKAAERGILFRELEQKGDDPAAVLIKMGIRAEMTRRSIVSCLTANMNLDDWNAHGIIKEQVQKQLPENIISLPGVRDKVFGEAIEWLENLSEEVIAFCEEAIDDGSVDIEETTFPAKKGFLSFLKGMLK